MPLKVTLAPGREVEFPDETLLQMGESILKTKKAERGFFLCYSGNQVLPGKEHWGGAYSIDHKDCGGAPKAGTFHTHPGDNSEPSWWDGLQNLEHSWHYSRQWISCVGGITDIEGRTVRCIAPKDIPDGLTIKAIERRKHEFEYAPIRADPELAGMFHLVARFRVRDIPKLVSPDILPRAGIRVEDVTFEGARGPSTYRKYIDTKTGEVISIEPTD